MTEQKILISTGDEDEDLIDGFDDRISDLTNEVASPPAISPLSPEIGST